MAAVACAKNAKNSLFLRFIIKNPCSECTAYNGIIRRNLTSICSRNVNKLRFFQNRFLNKRVQVVNYYVKKKEKSTGPSSAVWAALGGVTCGLLISAIAYLGRAEADGDDIYQNENFILAHVYRFRDRLHEYRESFVEPSSDVLLPDPLPEPYIQPKYTLVLELTDVLVHPEYDRSSGWRFRKRPGVSQFLKALTLPMYEIVIYTHENGFSSAPVIEGLDPEGFIMYKLFRDATKYMNGTHVKDLSKLNRDITKVILVDCDAKTSILQPRNSLVLKKWEGDPKDTSLLELIPFFHAISVSNVDDVRPVLDFYRGEEDVVAAFRRNQDILRQQQEEMLAQQQQQKTGSSFFGRGIFGRR
ncbi:mitochondrial import inner membrane translocase subunit TIM50-like [Hydractinia symbiolongicarpus]|uniref:mitochondrial import inner membrane translocase subunit TIM50-like n=1 Tax=Hydractinia symbiolongicarpus TaxID=13093 RepID=UPI00254FF983|nr:mitochondrial import inner membrane translocase subunit TIM50-like [Hydractinia symbiolongicarpus]